ncbi:hypothetical protein M011DRAFT_459770 [Sporormia fimetaria CBS 119925]|uniref:Cyclin n=1 Tax=Sporormia fimetaria CBS 119925 TaxID=1340428 RepID=A0A6A6V8L4_9PLEO|nr:hypothetical protein M011DRAFT_459770 [Sporormia fimetaria CBS 119925]
MSFSIPFDASLGTSHPYLSSSASSSASSVFSDAPSQYSNASIATSQSSVSSWESDEWSSRARPAGVPDDASIPAVARASTFPLYQPPRTSHQGVSERQLPPLRTDLAVPADQRQHPRRSSTLNHRAPPQLVRQNERRVNFVDCLVDSATQMVEVIWPLSVQATRCELASGRSVLPLRTYIQETLRRSRTSYSTLQVALYYLILIKGHVPKHDFTCEQAQDGASYRALQCGRRMFLAALILASKYLQDRNYSAQAWSNMSGLNASEINTNEMAFLKAVQWRLHITEPVWERWQEVVLRYAPSNTPPSPGAPQVNNWKNVIPLLSPGLENIVVARKSPVTPAVQFPTRLAPLQTCSGSQQSTPTPNRYCQLPQLPRLSRFLESKPEMQPPTPPLVRAGRLPTPCLTPLSAGSYTPAASHGASLVRRPSMSAAMAQAESFGLARSCMDPINTNIRNGLEAYHFPSRRPSLAPSITSSSASSPESMVTDYSRSSRASSISSASSVCLPNRPVRGRLARVATCRSARLGYPSLALCKEQSEDSSCEIVTPDLDTLHIEPEPTSVRMHGLITPPSTLTLTQTPVKTTARKRGRSSVDLQNNVRDLLHTSSASLRAARPVQRERNESFTVLADRSRAQPSRLLGGNEYESCAGDKGLQSPLSAGEPECRFPVQKDLGRKRTCCAAEALESLRREGPGMWEGIL